MSIQLLKTCGAAMLFVALIPGCSTPTETRNATVVRSGECEWNRSRCMYEGSYDTDEHTYAEEEARRLNRASSARLRRGW